MSPNRTATVAPMDLGRTIEFLDAIELLQRIVTRLAAVNRSTLDLDRMRQAQSVYEQSLLIAKATNSVSEMIEADYAFHIIVARACKNTYFIDLYRKLLLEAQRMLHLHYMLENCDSVVPVENLADDHLEIIDAITNEDAERAEIQAQKHADHIRILFTQLFNRRMTLKFSLNYKTKNPQPI